MSDLWSNPLSTSILMCANSECSGETARMRRLALAFAGRRCDKYKNLMNWLIYLFLYSASLIRVFAVRIKILMHTCDFIDTVKHWLSQLL